MFLIPIFNEDFEFKRLPYITIGLIILNTIIFFFTSNIVSHEMNRLRKVATELNRTTVQLIIENKAPEYFNKNLMGFDESTLGKIEKDSTIKRNSELYKKWITYYNEYKSLKKNFFYNKWGATPEHLNIITLITAMFIHASFFHLFFNMLFLWLVGLNIEDDWGRIVFILLYIIGGIFSSLIYAGMSTNKGIPLIGASGAISVIMGAFMIRHFKTRIRYFYFILLIFYPIWGTINIPAYVALPLWFIEQIFGASMSAHANGGVAYWAHISGFLFGVVAGLIIRFTGLEKNVLEPKIEEDREKIKLSPEMKAALNYIDKEEYTKAIERLRKHIEKNRNDIDAYNLLVDSLVKNEQGDEAIPYYEKIVELSSSNDKAMMHAYANMVDQKLLEKANPKTLFSIGNYFYRKKQYLDAADMYKYVIDRGNKVLSRIALLKIIYVYVEIERFTDAKKFLSILKEKFPDSMEYINAVNTLNKKGAFNEG
ncbi:hypothetical protein DRP44_05495 [candidate division TA06 bacterium]|uniref:Peptidase S54 rhomboid domain-containing protein n=1 Tax=candidate division TA06 bacterium TaxID=2250710 RepID=A0A660S7F0_UNCT6|nr:MAG: hypothetical protein DRP44_05495 [candidate division TA06 bacterium]